MRIGYIQTDPVFGDRNGNFRQVEEIGRNVRADLVVLPELFASGYTFTSRGEAQDLAESLEGPTAGFLAGLAATTGALVVAGFPEAGDDGGLYNSCMLVSRDGPLAVYRKIHLFNRERLWFDPGNRPPEVIEVAGLRIGMMICFDWIFPEMARSLALLGADVLAHPANLVLPYCQRAMVTRCLENRVYAVTANRIGTENRGDDDFRFTGSSQITGPDGSVLARAEETICGAATIEIDIMTSREKALGPHNNLMTDRRVEMYRLDD